MEIIVHSTLSNVGGQVTVATDHNQTVDSLITAFCVEKSIQHRKEYILKDRDQKQLSHADTLNSAGIQNGDIVFLAIKGNKREIICAQNVFDFISEKCYMILFCLHFAMV